MKRDFLFCDHMDSARKKAVELAYQDLSKLDLKSVVGSYGFINRHFNFNQEQGHFVPEDEDKWSSYLEVCLIRYLLNECFYKPSGELVPFRGLPGGNFYAPVLAKRTTDLICRIYKNDEDKLENSLKKLKAVFKNASNIYAEINIIGGIDLVFTYTLGDEEFPPNAAILFDKNISQVFSLDEVSALSTYFSMELIKLSK